MEWQNDGLLADRLTSCSQALVIITWFFSSWKGKEETITLPHTTKEEALKMDGELPP